MAPLQDDDEAALRELGRPWLSFILLFFALLLSLLTTLAWIEIAIGG